jgi:hypothetical protein
MEVDMDLEEEEEEVCHLNHNELKLKNKKRNNINYCLNKWDELVKYCLDKLFVHNYSSELVVDEEFGDFVEIYNDQQDVQCSMVVVVA